MSVARNRWQRIGSNIGGGIQRRYNICCRYKIGGIVGIGGIKLAVYLTMTV